MQWALVAMLPVLAGGSPQCGLQEVKGGQAIAGVPDLAHAHALTPRACCHLCARTPGTPPFFAPPSLLRLPDG